MNILWDFDGTLFNTYPAYTNIFMEVLGDSYSSEDIYCELKVSFSHAVGRLGVTEAQRVEIKRRISLLQPDLIIPFPGVENVLQAAHTNVIMTHKSRKSLLAILDCHGWTRYFKDMVTGDDGFPRKPDPASYRYLHERNNLHLVIGDRLIDILPGKELGLKTCLFQNDSPGADYYLRDYESFFELGIGG